MVRKVVRRDCGREENPPRSSGIQVHGSGDYPFRTGKRVGRVDRDEFSAGKLENADAFLPGLPYPFGIGRRQQRARFVWACGRIVFRHGRHAHIFPGDTGHTGPSAGISRLPGTSQGIQAPVDRHVVSPRQRVFLFENGGDISAPECPPRASSARCAGGMGVLRWPFRGRSHYRRRWRQERREGFRHEAQRLSEAARAMEGPLYLSHPKGRRPARGRSGRPPVFPES